MEIEEFEKEAVIQEPLVIEVVPTVRIKDGKVTVTVEGDDEEYEMDEDEWMHETLKEAKTLISDCCMLMDIIGDEDIRKAMAPDVLNEIRKVGGKCRSFIKEVEVCGV